MPAKRQGERSKARAIFRVVAEEYPATGSAIVSLHVRGDNTEPQTTHQSVQQEPRYGARSFVASKILSRPNALFGAHNYVGIAQTPPTVHTLAITSGVNVIVPPRTGLQKAKVNRRP